MFNPNLENIRMSPIVSISELVKQQAFDFDRQGDLRLSGEIQASTVGRRIVYTRAELIRFLEKHRWSRT